MGVEVRPVYLLGIEGKQRVKRWRYVAPYAFEEFVTVGWLPDGSWWVESSWYRLGAERFIGDTSAEARAAAMERAADLMAEQRPREGQWEEATAVFVPGVHPPRAAVVAEWPAGFGP